jgi:hypothetical protein
MPLLALRTGEKYISFSTPSLVFQAQRDSGEEKRSEEKSREEKRREEKSKAEQSREEKRIIMLITKTIVMKIQVMTTVTITITTTITVIITITIRIRITIRITIPITLTITITMTITTTMTMTTTITKPIKAVRTPPSVECFCSFERASLYLEPKPAGLGGHAVHRSCLTRTASVWSPTHITFP